MPSVVRAVEGYVTTLLTGGFEVASLPVGTARTPMELERANPEWIAAPSVGTAAAMLRSVGRFSLDGPVRRFDAEDFFFRGVLPKCELGAGERLVLCFDGLATLAEVFVDGTLVLASDNMFARHEVDVSAGAGRDRQLLIRCGALDAALTQRRPRPRWRTPMVEHQQLRYLRTTLLGRTPGWSPRVAPVGPWRPMYVVRRAGVEVIEARVHASVAGHGGRVEVTAQLGFPGGEPWRSATLSIEGPGASFDFDAPLVHDAAGLATLRVEAQLPQVARWWPHTHGEQPLYKLSLRGARGPRVDLGHVGFRSVELRKDGEFRFIINGERVFMRGACWTPLDIVSLDATAAAYRDSLESLREAGVNMLRVVGSMTYEAPVFYDLCDELGITLFHDLMFSNMDYPEDAGFVRSVTHEVTEVLQGLANRPSVVLVCGDSEGEQQAAMWGAPRGQWRRPLFSETLAKLCAELLPDVPYWASSSSGDGAYPHQPNAGPCSYYGVGAYLRPLEDARRAEVRFGSECLAFANVPEQAMLDALGGERTLHAHSPRWKERSPRDLGAGWDFDDVRDHYLRVLFGFDPVALRYAEHDRYVALSRVTTGEVMAAAFGEWRRARSTCGGALVWFLRDLWPGAGWGVIDASGVPKAAFYYLQRVWGAQGLVFSDEGLNGLYVHAWNERDEELAGKLRVELFRDGEQRVGEYEVPIELGPRAERQWPVAALLPAFVDLTNAFRFGPPVADLIVGNLVLGEGKRCLEAFFFPRGLPNREEGDLGLTAVATPAPTGYVLTVQTRRFAQSVAIEVGGYRAQDQYFHLAPGAERRIQLRALNPAGARMHGSVVALNSRVRVPIRIES